MKELWKDIEGYEGIYQVSNLGRVKGIKRYDSIGHLISDRVLKARVNNRGYLLVDLYKNGIRHTKLIHRLVAQTYIPNPENKPRVNHIDEVTTSNQVSNLEWTTPIENINHGTRNKRASKSRSKPIIAIDIATGEYNEYGSGKECAIKLGLHQGTVNHILKGRRKQTCGYTFKYK